MSCRLQLKPWNPLALSAAGTWPCRAVSGLSLGPQVALGTVSGMGWAAFEPPPPPQPHKTIEETATRPNVANLRYQSALNRTLMIPPSSNNFSDATVAWCFPVACRLWAHTSDRNVSNRTNNIV